MNIADALKILGLQGNPSKSRLRTAYKKRALEYHPDRNPGNPEAEKRFREIVIAHEILKNPKRTGPHRTSRGGKFASARDEYEKRREEIFSRIFQKARETGAERKNAPKDLCAQIEVTLEELLRDAEKEIFVSRRIRCAACEARGVACSAGSRACPACEGAGEVRFRRGLADLRIPCATCCGTGESARENCGVCDGAGRISAKERVRVRIPAATREGAQLKIRGKGDEGADASGDLIITVRAKTHPLFQREGNHILFELPMSFSQAALGHECLVPTLRGTRKIKIPAGTQSGRVFRLRGEGLSPAGGRNAGEQRVRVFVETPTKLNQRQRELLREFQGISRPPPTQEPGNIWTR